MFNLIVNKFGKVYLCQNTGMEPIFIYTLTDDDGRSDDCEYAFVFRGDKIRLYGWHFGHDTTFTYQGNWLDNETLPEPFHDQDYQQYLIGRLRLCIAESLNIIALTTKCL